MPLGSAAQDGPIERRDVLGGVLHDYYRRAAWLSDASHGFSAPNVLFVPQLISVADRPHPLITAYVEAAMRFRERTAAHVMDQPVLAERRTF